MLTSVHAFASDPRRGVFILLILVVFIGGSLALFAARANDLKPGGFFAPISREGALVLNNLVLSTACATVFVGTLYPLALEALTGEKISVGAPFYNATFVPLVPALVPLDADRPDARLEARRSSWAPRKGSSSPRPPASLPCSSLPLGTAVPSSRSSSPVSPSSRSSAPSPISTAGSSAEVSGGAFWRRALGLPRSAWGTAFAHAGLGVTLLGLAATGWGVEKIMVDQARRCRQCRAL